jgi:putative membrane protein
MKIRVAVWIMFGPILLLSPPAILAQDRPYDGSWGMHPIWWAWGTGGMVMMLMMLVFWSLIIAAMVLGIRWLIRQGDRSRSDTALEILRQRYARGEINREEFEAKRRDLT